MVIFHEARWRNFLSTGNNWTTISLDRSSNTLIVGTNGAGKSTLLDALCFGLFGKPFRKINKPQLINSINQRDCVVEIEFSSGQKVYRIVRGMKPNIFEVYCNNELINQSAKNTDYQEILEKNILKFNYKSFTQVVILGSASFVPFMQLSAADRRAIIEELLDIQIFSSMNKLVKEKMDDIRDKTRDNKYNMDLTSEKIKMQKHNIEEHRKHNDEEIERKKSEIATSEQQSLQLQNDVALIQKHVSVLTRRIEDESKVRSKNKQILQMESKILSNISKITKDIDFLQNNEVCHTCNQPIDKEFAQEKITEREAKKKEIQNGLEKLAEEMERTNRRISDINLINVDITKHNNAVTEHNATIRAINNYINKLQKEISNLLERKGNIIDENERLVELKQELKELMANHEQLLNDKQYYEYASTLLKDTGIKTKIIKQYLPIMNKLINKYLNAMDFFVNFEMGENFEETIKSRHRDVFSYANFSEGEKQKIDLALLFTWRQIAKLKNSTNTNLLILDEVFDSSLDTSSVELLMNLINEFSDDTNVFVISHKGDQLFDKFRSVIKFNKKGNFSVIEGK
jgi:DNA repair exonuclease SbcCD ATPase subunit